VSVSRGRVAGVMRLELLIQRREPLTVLYVLVLGLLAAAFAAAGPVELVRGRGAVPRDAAWSLMLASTALTAFGQVITTMVAATVVLRDRQDRVNELLATSRLTRGEYLLGKLGAALLVLCMIYASIPVGLAIGAAVGGGSPAGALFRSLVPFAVVVVPTMLAIGGLQFAAGVLSGRLWVIVGQGLVLIWCWSAATDASGRDGVSALVLLADPFGSAPLLHATRAWSETERAMRPFPVTWPLLAGRAVWLALGTLAVCWAVRRGERVPRLPASSSSAPARSANPAAVRAGVSARAPRAVAWRGAVATATYVSRWMHRDTGWRVLALLGATNVAVHAFQDARGVGGAAAVTQVALTAIALHARLFLILLATIYAGELVWREREERSAPLFDVLPLPTWARVTGGVIGVIVAQTALVLLLAAVAGLAAMGGSRQGLALPALVAATVQGVLGPFVLWMVLALAVHSVVQQKVAAHLLCIAGWVGAVLLAGAATPGEGQLAPQVAAGVALASVMVAVRWWRRGVLPTRRPEVRDVQ